MMHGHEKSDFVIVAVKPANKAAPPAAEQSAAELVAAEPMEPRAETKGNVGRQSTCLTQSRVSVSQALDRIRQVAKERKKERFTALFHHINVDLLEQAFYELKENAAPGVDRLTWKDYEADLERKLEDLHDQVQRGAYRALPSRRVYIPKPELVPPRFHPLSRFNDLGPFSPKASKCQISFSGLPYTSQSGLIFAILCLGEILFGCFHRAHLLNVCNVRVQQCQHSLTPSFDGHY